MIVDLPDTKTSQVAKTLVMLRREGHVGSNARVLTLVVSTLPGHEEAAVEAAQAAAREHPCRVIVVVREGADRPTRLSGEVRVGGDAGASEVIILRTSGELNEPDESLISALLLPDDPVVSWWPSGVPEDVSSTPLGVISQRRITDAAAEPDPLDALGRLAASWRPGDTDLSWTRLTLWRTQLTSILDQYGTRGLRDITVHGALTSPSTVLLAAWLQHQLSAVPVRLAEAEGEAPVQGVRLARRGGDVEISRPVGDVAQLYLPGQSVQHVALPVRTLPACLAEELRRLDDDVVLGRVLTHGLPACNLSPVAPSPR
ncbi:OpcA protein [Galactobacter valiniphilus]|uniref:OpcA protein n=1 Tax=Galactobacter valiniphilus TaxID=2676122 RepID=A0A399JDS9_9MICC|nr:glucose-6-phosphate dehydrogenase assembly protein OpcA [Galactobacter valiniphilus]RII42192.1 OpcA protein [Galactobacter valiniphilus]